jgi:cellulose synthase/poly-beta-1,6-N-acetylglucosamine synthase-like glycosyltransferase
MPLKINNINPGNLTVTVCISTCYGGISLPSVIESIKASKGVLINRLVVIADVTPIPSSIMDTLLENNVEVIWNDVNGTHNKKLMQVRDMCFTDILITTCDDVMFETNTILEIVKIFSQDEKTTMVSTVVMPLSPETLIESVLGSSLRITENIVNYWNGGDNYLASSGRCLSFRNEFFKKFRNIPGIVNNDQFFYFENKRLGGLIEHNPRSVVYIRPPQTLKDHMRPSSRYQFGQYEVQNYFPYSISGEYAIPFRVKVKSFWQEFLLHPVTTLLYVLIFIYTRMFPWEQRRALAPIWSDGLSTKKITIK